MKENPAMPDARVFLGWNSPVLPVAVNRLVKRYTAEGALDLGRVIVVVPGQRAGRRLLELLAFKADDDKLLFTPPDVVTEGRLPELLYAPPLPFADDLTQLLAWQRALVEMPEVSRRAFLPVPPGPDDHLRWLELARQFARLHVELGAEALDFAAVSVAGKEVAGFNESARWMALGQLQARYRHLLGQQKLIDQQSARLTAISTKAVASERDIILLGTVELNGLLKRMLAQIQPRVTAYVAAPDEKADAFDDLGCLITAEWLCMVLPVADTQLRQVNGTIDQAEAVAAWLGELSGRYRVDEITVGIADAGLAPQLQRELSQAGVASDYVEGSLLGASAPYRLLEAAVGATSGDYDSLASLIRHPDVTGWLTRDKDRSLLTQLDNFYATHFPSRVKADRIGDGRDWPDLKAAIQKIERWLRPLSAPRPLRAWGESLRDLLGTIYDERNLELDRPEDDQLFRAFRQLIARLERAADIPPGIDTTPFSAADAFTILFAPLADDPIPVSAVANAIALLGWLELPLDDAPALLVTSFNDGFVPSSAAGDPFLPNSLRQRLGLMDDDRRYARDAYASCVVAHSRETLRLVFARFDARTDPLRPSRLLFTGDDDLVVGRAKRYFTADPQQRPARVPLLGRGIIAPAESAFVIPTPDAVEPIAKISVTDFKRYLACPYRYYLARIKYLQSLDDRSRELDGGTFGTLIHFVLSEFGRDSSVNSSKNADAIAEFLSETLSRVAEDRFGREFRRPAIRLQVEQARRRLRSFATRQAELSRDGWRIAYAEDELDSKSISTEFACPDGQIALQGRIDRIDFHDSTGMVRIIDYKTADNAVTPEKAHRDKSGWIDLQLPLYRHLWHLAAPMLPADSPIQLGYFNLPKTDAVDIEVADWDANTLDEADSLARSIVAKIRSGNFTIATEPPQYDDYADICLSQIMKTPPVDDNTGEEPE